MDPAGDPNGYEQRAHALASHASRLLDATARRHVETAREIQDTLRRLEVQAADTGIEYGDHPALSKALHALATEADVLLGSAARITGLSPLRLTHDWPRQPALTSTFSGKEPALLLTLPPRQDLAVRLATLDADRPDRVAHLHPLLSTAYGGRTFTAQQFIRAYAKTLRAYAKGHGLDASRFHHATARLRQEFPRYLHALVHDRLARDLVLTAWRESSVPAEHQ